MTLISDPPVVHPFMGRDAAFLLDARARQRGDHPMLIWAPFAGEGETWSYAKFAHDVARIAGGLHARGIRAGDRVLVHLENCPETILARFACWWLGATAVLSNAHWMGPEIAPVVASLGVRAAITQPKFARAHRRALPVARMDRGHADRCRREPEPAAFRAKVRIVRRALRRAAAAPRARPDGAGRDPVHHRLDLAAEGGAVDPRQYIVGRQGRRAAARTARRRYLSGHPAAVSRRRLHLVVHSGVLRRRDDRAAAEIFREPVLADGARNIAQRSSSHAGTTDFCATSPYRNIISGNGCSGGTIRRATSISA